MSKGFRTVFLKALPEFFARLVFALALALGVVFNRNAIYAMLPAQVIYAISTFKIKREETPLAVADLALLLLAQFWAKSVWALVGTSICSIVYCLALLVFGFYKWVKK